MNSEANDRRPNRRAAEDGERGDPRQEGARAQVNFGRYASVLTGRRVTLQPLRTTRFNVTDVGNRMVAGTHVTAELVPPTWQHMQNLPGVNSLTAEWFLVMARMRQISGKGNCREEDKVMLLSALITLEPQV